MTQFAGKFENHCSKQWAEKEPRKNVVFLFFTLNDFFQCFWWDSLFFSKPISGKKQKAEVKGDLCVSHRYFCLGSMRSVFPQVWGREELDTTEWLNWTDWLGQMNTENMTQPDLISPCTLGLVLLKVSHQIKKSSNPLLEKLDGESGNTLARSPSWVHKQGKPSGTCCLWTNTWNWDSCSQMSMSKWPAPMAKKW